MHCDGDTLIVQHGLAAYILSISDGLIWLLMVGATSAVNLAVHFVSAAEQAVPASLTVLAVQSAAERPTCSSDMSVE